MSSDIPDGDIILHGGDIMNSGYDPVDIFNFLDWYGALPHKHKVFIAGNHDRYFENHSELARDIIKKKNGAMRKGKITYLEDSEVVIDGIKIYGSPWQPEFCNWAFNLDRGPDLKRVWDNIPLDTDVLITHGPPHGILDLVQYDKIHVGCEELLAKVFEVKPMIHLFGHIHETYGVHHEQDIAFVNASICNLRYNPINKPIVFDFDPITSVLTEVVT